MSEINTGGWAFPNHGYEGMTLRDYFAAKAMQIMWDAYDKGYCGLNNNDAPNVETIAKGAYQMADAMLEARKLMADAMLEAA
jgi:hypothetical protein